MVDDNLDLEELIGLVTSAGEELEESSKVIVVLICSLYVASIEPVVH